MMNPRSRARLLVTLVYVVALACAAALLLTLPAWHPLARAFAADAVATVVVFAASIRWRNASLYDPYWSVIPPVLCLWWIAESGDLTARGILALGVVLIWSVRLTRNWVLRWEGLQDEDWRYRMLAEQHGRLYPLVNFFGIHLLPTVLVFAGCVPLYYAITTPGPLGLLDLIATLGALGFTMLETLADRELVAYRRLSKRPSPFLCSGVWRHVRHPNYTGEIGFWWSLFLFAPAASVAFWWTVAGAVAMTWLFVGVSVPMMTKRMTARYEGYAEHAARVPALLPHLFGGRGKT